MLRLAFTPRWLGLLAVALLIATVFATLGNWQLSRSRQQAPQVQAAQPQPLTEVFGPHQALDAPTARTPVIVTGTVDDRPAVLVTDRRYQGRNVSWVVVPVLVDGTDARLPVVLGVIPAGRPAPEVHPAEIRTQTFLQASEAPQPPGSDGHYPSLGVAELLNAWGPPVYGAFVFADQVSADAAAPGAGITALPQDPPEADDVGYAILNLSYALQWWVFAAFAIFIWWRLLQRAHAVQTSEEVQRTPAETPQRQLS